MNAPAVIDTFMNIAASASPRELTRQRKISEIADWYREGSSVHDAERSGRDVVVTVEHLDRLIRVESHEQDSPRRIPIEERMEFDKDVLDYLKRNLMNGDNAIILDTSDIPGRIEFDKGVVRGITAKLSVFEIDAEEPVDDHTFMKRQPEFPDTLKRKLLAIPKSPGDGNVILRTGLAEAFVSEYLHCVRSTGDAAPAQP